MDQLVRLLQGARQKVLSSAVHAVSGVRSFIKSILHRLVERHRICHIMNHICRDSHPIFRYTMLANLGYMLRLSDQTPQRRQL